MGLISGLLTLPLAPVRGVVWITEKIGEEAFRRLYDEDEIRRQLIALEHSFEAGELSEEEYEASERMLLVRLSAARAARAATGDPEDPARGSGPPPPDRNHA